eukprot:TRINITY_DN9205_c0_g1_i1.p1 TRINITY_DN9205_c0_g1~~TRINITY_DN9205_c0_g1_i1.p1  ORF type:complete len:308 (+),score=46.57 TRINITY_DN9205_c0_g1_i1:60-983(+)
MSPDVARGSTLAAAVQLKLLAEPARAAETSASRSVPARSRFGFALEEPDDVGAFADHALGWEGPSKLQFVSPWSTPTDATSGRGGRSVDETFACDLVGAGDAQHAACMPQAPYVLPPAHWAGGNWDYEGQDSSRFGVFDQPWGQHHCQGMPEDDFLHHSAAPYRSDTTAWLGSHCSFLYCDAEYWHMQGWAEYARQQEALCAESWRSAAQSSNMLQQRIPVELDKLLTPSQPAPPMHTSGAGELEPLPKATCEPPPGLSVLRPPPGLPPAVFCGNMSNSKGKFAHESGSRGQSPSSNAETSDTLQTH